MYNNATRGLQSLVNIKCSDCKAYEPTTTKYTNITTKCIQSHVLSLQQYPKEKVDNIFRHKVPKNEDEMRKVIEKRNIVDGIKMGGGGWGPVQ